MNSKQVFDDKPGFRRDDNRGEPLEMFVWEPDEDEDELTIVGHGVIRLINQNESVGRNLATAARPKRVEIRVW